MSLKSAAPVNSDSQFHISEKSCNPFVDFSVSFVAYKCQQTVLLKCVNISLDYFTTLAFHTMPLKASKSLSTA